MTCIMIIDDDDLLIKTMEIAMENRGYEVISALSGKEGLDLLKTAKPDLILLDIMMPFMDGWKTLKEIKGDETLASIPVIFLTVKELTTDILAKKEKLGFSDFVTKPFDIKDLYLRITKALQS